MTFCLLILLLALTAFISTLLPGLADGLFARSAPQTRKALCANLDRLNTILAVIALALLGALLFNCASEYSALLSNGGSPNSIINRCRLIMMLGLVLLLILLYVYVTRLACCSDKAPALRIAGIRLPLLISLLTGGLVVFIWFCCRDILGLSGPTWSLCHTLLVLLLLCYIALCFVGYLRHKFCKDCQNQCNQSFTNLMLAITALLLFLLYWVYACCEAFKDNDYDLAMVGIWWQGKYEGESGVHLRWSFRTQPDNGAPLTFPENGFDIQRRASGSNNWITINSEPIFPIREWGNENAIVGDMAQASATERLHPDSWPQFRGEPVTELLQTLDRAPYQTLYYIQEPAPRDYPIAPANPFASAQDRQNYLNDYYTARDTNPPLSYWDLVPMDTMMTAAMHSEVARLLGLYYLDRDAQPDTEYDYRVVGNWNDRERRYTVSRISRDNTQPLETPVLRNVSSPVDVGEIDGETLISDSSVAMSWTPPGDEDPPETDTRLDTIKSVLFTVEHSPIYIIDDAGLVHRGGRIQGEGLLANQALPECHLDSLIPPDDISPDDMENGDGFAPARRYTQLLNDSLSQNDPQDLQLPPVLVAPLEDESTGQLRWPTYFFYHRNLDYGCHAYRVTGMDIFGRPSATSSAEVVEVTDITAPPSPAMVNVQLYQRQDRQLSADIRRRFFPDENPANDDPDANADESANLYAFVVSWVWSEEQQQRAPDTAYFNLFANLPEFDPFPNDNGPSIDAPAWKVPTNWSVREIGGNIPIQQTSPLPASYRALGHFNNNTRYYEVSFTDVDLRAAGISIADLGLDADDNTPVKYSYFGVNAVDRRPYNNPGDVSTPVVTASRDLIPPAAPNPPPALSAGPMEADKQGNSSLALNWQGRSLYRYGLYRADVRDIIAVADALEGNRFGEEQPQLPACFRDAPPARQDFLSDEAFNNAVNDHQIKRLTAINIERLLQDKIIQRISPIPLEPDNRNVSYNDKVDATVSSKQLYFATAFDKAGNESLLSCPGDIVLVPDGVAPRVPVIQSINSGDMQIALSWHTNLEADLAYYNVYRTSNPEHLNSRRKMQLVAALQPDGGNDASFTPQSNDAIAGGDAPYDTWTLVDENVQPMQQYYYRIEAVDIVGNRSALSNQTRAAAFDATPPATPNWDNPGQVVAGNDDAPRIILSWLADADDPQLRTLVQRREVDSNFWRAIQGWQSSGGYSLTDSFNIEENTGYEYRLRVMDPSGNRSDWSDILRVDVPE